MTIELLDLNKGLSRRVFIKGLGYVTAGFVLSTLGGCETIAENIANRPTRYRLRTGSPEVDAVIATYADAVSQMKALPGTDPRSWDAQSDIHGTAFAFNFCQHGTDHFFSWHRAYLFYFEQICQTLTGDTSFGLPYWNWNQDPDIHPEFTNASSTLNHSRNNTTVAGNIAFEDANLDTIFSDINFFTFSSQLEGSPHNIAHTTIGQDMAGGASPQDPLFWAHHCMVDYCWNKWNIELENDNTSDPAWIDTAWTHFVDGDGNPVTSITAGLTTILPLLSYQYESSAIGSSPASALRVRSAADYKRIEKRVREGADIRFEIKQRISIAQQARISIDRPFSKESDMSTNDFSALVDSDTAKERIFVNVNYARLPKSGDFYVRVFINLPNANVNTPTNDPHYAGSFAFFGTQAEDDHGTDDAHHHKTDFLVNVTPTLQRLERGGALRASRRISVQLVAVPVSGEFVRPDEELDLRHIDIIISPVLIRRRP